MNYEQRKYSISRWEKYDEKYWSTQEEMRNFFNIKSCATLIKWIRESKTKIEDKIVIRGNHCLHLYNRQQILRLIHDKLSSKSKKRVADRVIKRIRNKDKWISYQDACVLYGIGPMALSMRISRWDKEVESVFVCSRESIRKYGGGKRYFNKEQLEEAMNYFNQRKYSVSGRISANKPDRHIVDVFSARGSKRTMRVVQDLGYSAKELHD